MFFTLCQVLFTSFLSHSLLYNLMFACMLQGHMKCTITTVTTSQVFKGLNMAGNIWDTVSAKLSNIQRVLVIFRHLNEEMLNTVPLKLVKLKCKNYNL